MKFSFDTPQLETERLLLRKLTMGDVGDVYHYGAQPEVSAYCIWETHKSPADAESFIRTAIIKYDNNEPSDWAICEKKDMRVIGALGYVQVWHEHMRCEVGYALSKHYWNKGYATEGLKAFIDYNFNIAMMHRIEARCIQENIGSYRVMEKAGMQFEGILREQLFIKGKFRSMKLYSILNK
jgi:ribosomal-protein-alanine N-acetyltransferase